ncbi:MULTISPECIES: choice-of-anchor I family protein [unclassified Okeania]|uniref:choice-of-anchor I family protein n=1 Tax=unclassified Okeania TaxID=2634635 RepID=UPI0013BD2350|nr:MULTISPECIES: choice-of-anchor I family protein [unclassified Okeania]NES79715.1 alkaline phosphatase [Okeania sp. SIO1H4]NET17198.1 alkaline phosphatase [Okeania sp. SIO1H6]NET23592.1 alkaline phosphatase [Okeania sp. SIO1H5]NET97205.1 alkaline phosphatase [Okeania sp. SIO1H2]
MKNYQDKSKYTNTNVLEKIIEVTVKSSMALALMAAPSKAIGLSFTPVGTYATGVFDDSAARITAFDPNSERLFVVNDNIVGIDVLNISNPYAPILDFTIDLSLFGNFGGVNSVAYSNSIFAVAVEDEIIINPGEVLFFDNKGNKLNQITVGALPDLLTFTPDGTKLLVANEAEPTGYLNFDIDPEGSVSIIDLSHGIENLTHNVAGFQAFNAQVDELRAEGVRIFGPGATIFSPGATVAQDLEPEAIAISEDGTTAWVTLQENNAIGILDIETATFTDIVALGFKDHSLPGNGIDASDKDGEINIENYPVFGMYQPDEIASYTVGGKTYLVTANEGDSRFYRGFDEEVELRANSLPLDPNAFPDADILRQEGTIGRLEITNSLGDTDGDRDFDELYVFGGRSFSIWDEAGGLVFDSGDDFEQITAKLFPEFFNSNDDDNDFDNRSDNKGPEPEGVAIGMVGNSTLAFIGLERIGGFMTYDVSNPFEPKFISYTNNRNFSGDPEDGTAGDLGPEGLTFISAEDSPNGKALLVLANEVSGTTTIYEINSVPEPGTIFGLLVFGAAGKLLLKRHNKTTEENSAF